MDLLDRYVRTLRLLLPKKQREDIIRELSEEIREQVAQKEEGLGRPLSADEWAAVVGQYGHPLLIAARYRPQRYLVGPVVYPYYVMVLQAALALTVILTAISIGQASWNEVPIDAMGVAKELVGKVLRVLGWLTVLAVFVERYLVNAGALDQWTPRLPGPPLEDAMKAVDHAARVVHDSTSTAERRDR